MTYQPKPLRKPSWLKIKLPSGKNYLSVREIVEKNELHTICSSGKCPNINECWGARTATLMILGDVCTRSCKFCNVKTGKPQPVDQDEPRRVAETVKKMGLKHVVLTSVDRDDLPDKGAEAWRETIVAIKTLVPSATIEALIPDFDGEPELINRVVDSGPEVISHNLETVKRLTPMVRSRAKYETSLKVLEVLAKSNKTSVKSGVMVGLGENKQEVLETLCDMKNAGATIITIGQYLQPTLKHLAVREYISPETFELYKTEALKLGFRHVESAPLVRSSFKAEKHVE